MPVFADNVVCVEANMVIFCNACQHTEAVLFRATEVWTQKMQDGGTGYFILFVTKQFFGTLIKNKNPAILIDADNGFMGNT